MSSNLILTAIRKTSMKKLIFILFLFVSTVSYSQQYYKAKTFSFTTIKKSERWKPWSRPEVIDVMVEVDSIDNSITLYTNKVQIYTIYRTEKFTTDGETIYWYYCEDRDKIVCQVQLTLDKNGLNKNEMEIKYADLKLKYELK